ncbi:MAG: N-acyl amino acid synthase FeeM domain-containing protein [Thiobacillus sp.]
MVSIIKSLFANRPRQPADDFDKTIVNIPSPYRMKDLCPDMREAPGANVENMGEQQFKIRLAHTDASRSAATMLVQQRYAWRGYKADEIKKQPNRITLVAYFSDQIVGSLNIGYDSPEGLSADERYKEEIDALRAQGLNVGEITKLAIDENVGNKQVLAGMINIAYLYGLIHGVTDAVIEVTPRHKPFYQRMLDFQQIAGERFYAASNTDVVLMHIKIAHIGERIEAVGGKGSGSGDRSIYPYFFHPKDQQGMMERLKNGS